MEIPSWSNGMAKQQGFTLIEMMITISIIGILAAMALPAYSRYQSRAKMAAGVAELSILKDVMEVSINQGSDISALSDIGGTSSTGNCSNVSAMASASAGTASITCTVANAPPAVNGQTITWLRNQANGWVCSTTAPNSFAPASCPGT